jgi:hypothetical protein
MPVGMSKGAITTTRIISFTSDGFRCFWVTDLVMLCDMWYQLKPKEVLILKGTGHQATGANSDHQSYGTE